MNLNAGIIGAGTMGCGIAQVAAVAGWNVYLFDNNRRIVTKALKSISHFVNRMEEKQKIPAGKAAEILSKITSSHSFNDLKQCQLVIEAIPENLETKKEVFKRMESVVDDKCILASNTSSLSLTSIAAACRNADRVIGIHFFNPAPLMKLVEIVKAEQTDSSVLEMAKIWVQEWGKTSVIVKDSPGFIVNKVARPFYGESLRIYEEGIAGFSQIDQSLKLAGGFRMGPFELMDLIGLDINLAVTESIFYSYYGDSRYTPSLVQKRMVEAGWLGKKTGKGFYDYKKSQVSTDVTVDPELTQNIFHRVITMIINEAFDTRFRNIASIEDIDLAMKLGTNYPKGPFEWANELGIERIVNHLDQLFDRYREERYRCCPLLRDGMK